MTTTVFTGTGLIGSVEPRPGMGAVALVGGGAAGTDAAAASFVAGRSADARAMFPSISVRMRASSAFEIEEAGTTPFDGLLYEDDALSVHTAILDHRIPCLGFAATEKAHLNVRTDELERLGIPPGRWLNELKQAIRGGEPDDTEIVARWRDNGAQAERSLRLGDLRGRLVVETPGQRLAYVVDTIFSRGNMEKIAALVHGEDRYRRGTTAWPDSRRAARRARSRMLP